MTDTVRVPREAAVLAAFRTALKRIQNIKGQTDLAARLACQHIASQALSFGEQKMPAMTVAEYVAEYEFRGETDYTPTDNERALIEDAINGYLADAMLAASPQGEGSSADDIGHELIAFANQIEGAPHDVRAAAVQFFAERIAYRVTEGVN